MKVNNTFIALFIALLSLFNLITATNLHGNNFHQSIWYIRMDQTSNPVKHHFGMKNFYDSRERSFYTNQHLMIKTSKFRIRVDRQTTDNIKTFNPNDPQDYYSNLDKQFIQYFPTIDFEDPRGGYYVLEDESNSQAVGNSNLNTYCEVKFMITYYRNYKLARLRYEEIINTALAVPEPVPAIVFGGPNGMIDSTNWDYFTQKYLNFWCPYRFGVYTHDMLDSSSLDEIDHIYLRNVSASVKPIGTYDVSLPVSTNPGDNSALDECDFRGDADHKHYLFMPSEFSTNCFYSVDTSPHPLTLSNTAVEDKHYVGCFNKYDSTPATPEYYTYNDVEDKCQIGGRAFIKVKSLTQLNPQITFNLECSFNGTTVTGSYTNSYNLMKDESLKTVTDTTLTTFFGNRSCTYDNITPLATTRSTCQSYNFSCAVTTIAPDYFDFSISLTNNPKSDSNSGGDTGTITYGATLKVRLNLYGRPSVS